MRDSAPGTIIVLNGGASVGKTSIAKAIQRTFDAQYPHVGIDLFWLEVFPWEWTGAATQIFQFLPHLSRHGRVGTRLNRLLTLG